MAGWKMIDLESVKTQADLLAICGRDVQLKKVANTGGGEWAGPCIFCGGKDRFRVQPESRRWLCRQCTSGKWQDVIAYIARRDNLDPKKYEDLEEICRRAIGNIPTSSSPRPAPAPRPAYQAPADDWQAAARKIIEICQENLWGPAGKKALKYLTGRGLSESTIRKFNLGYSGGFWFQKWNVQAGVLIPCQVSGETWYLKISYLPGYLVKCHKCGQAAAARKPCPGCGNVSKYTQVGGSRPAVIYNADQLAGACQAVVCEGEFDCMIGEQEYGAVMPTITLGSATNRPDLATWGAYLLPVKMILLAYDADQAGESGAAALGELLGNRAHLANLPEGFKDLNDYHLGGGDLLAWVTDAQYFYADNFFSKQVA